MTKFLSLVQVVKQLRPTSRFVSLDGKCKVHCTGDDAQPVRESPVCGYTFYVFPGRRSSERHSFEPTCEFPMTTGSDAAPSKCGILPEVVEWPAPSRAVVRSAGTSWPRLVTRPSTPHLFGSSEHDIRPAVAAAHKSSSASMALNISAQRPARTAARASSCEGSDGGILT